MVACGVASLLFFCYLLYADIKKENYKILIVTILLFISILASGVLAFQSYRSRQLGVELANLKPPARCDFDFYSNGEQCGFVIPVISILEEHKDEMPLSVTIAAERQSKACAEIRGGVGYEAFLADREYTEHAAEAMCQIVNQLRSR